MLSAPPPPRRIVYTSEMRFGPAPAATQGMVPVPEPPVPESSESESDHEIPWDQLSEATQQRIIQEAEDQYDPPHRGDSD